MKQTESSIALFEDGSGIVAMDIDASDRYVAALGSLGKACLYDRETK